jgi:hypothetical protein
MGEKYDVGACVGITVGMVMLLRDCGPYEIMYL